MSPRSKSCVDHFVVVGADPKNAKDKIDDIPEAITSIRVAPVDQEVPSGYVRVGEPGKSILERDHGCVLYTKTGESLPPISGIGITVFSGDQPPEFHGFTLVERPVRLKNLEGHSGDEAPTLALYVTRDPRESALGHVSLVDTRINQEESSETELNNDTTGITADGTQRVSELKEDIETPAIEAPHDFDAHTEGRSVVDIKIEGKTVPYLPSLGLDVGDDSISLAPSGVDLGFELRTRTVASFWKVPEETVLDHYPEEGTPGYEPIPYALSAFCMPSGIQMRMHKEKDRYHTFVLTDVSGATTYGFCLTFYVPATAPQGRSEHTRAVHVPYVSKCLCILSKSPFFHLFYMYLSEFRRIAMGDSAVPPERLILNLFELPVPAPGKAVFNFPIGNKKLAFSFPPPQSLPIIGSSIVPIFRLLKVETVLSLFVLMCLEKKILLVSDHLPLLTPVAEGITALLFPLKWLNVFIPVCPDDMLDLLQAPMPFIIGITTDAVDISLIPADVYTVYLDGDKIFKRDDPMGFDEEERIPFLPGQEDLYERLQSAAGHLYLEGYAEFDDVDEHMYLDASITSSQTPSAEQVRMHHIRMEFLRFWIKTMGHYKEFVRVYDVTEEIPEDAEGLDAIFDRAEFIEEVKEADRPFVGALIETQSFMKFIEQRSEYSSRDHEFSYFDGCVERFRSGELDVQKMVSFGGYRHFQIPGPNISDLPPSKQYRDTGEDFPRFDLQLFAPGCRDIVKQVMVDSTMMGMVDSTKAKDAPVAGLERKPSGRLNIEIRTLTDADVSKLAKEYAQLIYTSWFLMYSHYIPMCRRPEVALWYAYIILEHMRLNHVSPTNKIFVYLLGVCADLRLSKHARLLFKIMNAAQVRSDAVSTGLYMKAIATRRRGSTAVHNSGGEKQHRNSRTKQNLPRGERIDKFSALDADIDKRQKLSIQSADFTDVSVCWFNGESPRANTKISVSARCNECDRDVTETDIMLGWMMCVRSGLKSRCLECEKAFMPELVISSLDSEETKTVPFLSPISLLEELDALLTNDKATFNMSLLEMAQSVPMLYANMTWYMRNRGLPFTADQLVGGIMTYVDDLSVTVDAKQGYDAIVRMYDDFDQSTIDVDYVAMWKRDTGAADAIKLATKKFSIPEALNMRGYDPLDSVQHASITVPNLARHVHIDLSGSIGQTETAEQASAFFDGLAAAARVRAARAAGEAVNGEAKSVAVSEAARQLFRDAIAKLARGDHTACAEAILAIRLRFGDRADLLALWSNHNLYEAMLVIAPDDVLRNEEKFLTDYTRGVRWLKPNYREVYRKEEDAAPELRLVSVWSYFRHLRPHISIMRRLLLSLAGDDGI
eukprot:Clim_evm32s207 gene=Clim_evmTU32s207